MTSMSKGGPNCRPSSSHSASSPSHGYAWIRRQLQQPRYGGNSGNSSVVDEHNRFFLDPTASSCGISPPLFPLHQAGEREGEGEREREAASTSRFSPPAGKCNGTRYASDCAAPVFYNKVAARLYRDYYGRPAGPRWVGAVYLRFQLDRGTIAYEAWVRECTQ